MYNNAVKSFDPFNQIKDGDIQTYNSSVCLRLHLNHTPTLLTVDKRLQGSTPSSFVDTGTFETIVKQQIKHLEDPSLKCCQLVYDELIKILGQTLPKIVGNIFLLRSSFAREA